MLSLYCPAGEISLYSTVHISISEKFVDLKPPECSSCGRIDDLFFTPSSQQCVVINLRGTSSYTANYFSDTCACRLFNNILITTMVFFKQ